MKSDNWKRWVGMLGAAAFLVGVTVIPDWLHRKHDEMLRHQALCEKLTMDYSDRINFPLGRYVPTKGCP